MRPVVDKDAGGAGKRSFVCVDGCEDHGQIHSLQHLCALVNAAAHKDETFDALFVPELHGGLEFVRFLVDELGQKGGRQTVRVLKHRLCKRIQERVFSAAQNQRDGFRIRLLETARVGVADKMTFCHDLLNLFACLRIHIRSVIQHAGNGRDTDAGKSRNIADGVDFQPQRSFLLPMAVIDRKRCRYRFPTVCIIPQTGNVVNREMRKNRTFFNRKPIVRAGR